MKPPIKVSRSFKAKGKHTSVTCTARPIEAQLDERVVALGPAQAIAEAIERGIETNPHQSADGRRRWVRTGKLADNLAVRSNGNGYSIVAPPGRLQRPELLKQLTEDVAVIRNPMADPQVKRAVADANAKIVKVR